MSGIASAVVAYIGTSDSSRTTDDKPVKSYYNVCIASDATMRVTSSFSLFLGGIAQRLEQSAHN